MKGWSISRHTDGTWILDDEDGHRIPFASHPQGRYPHLSNVLSEIRREFYGE